MENISPLKNYLSLTETLDTLRYILLAKKQTGSLSLLDKAVSKSEKDPAFANKMQSALCCGSTVEYRDLFSEFGDYWENRQSEIPHYPHMNAVNGIDSAMASIKQNCIEESIELYTFLHLQNEN